MYGFTRSLRTAGVYPRRRSGPRCWRGITLVALLGATLSIGGRVQGEETGLPLPGGARQLAPESPVWVDAAAGAVLVDAEVVLRDRPLEMFACPKGMKEHESIVAIDAPAFLIHTALLAVGAEPGRPVRFNPEFSPPEGDEVEITIQWKTGDETLTARAQDWIRDAGTGQAMSLPFVFAGSGFWTDPTSGKQHYMADGGDLICVSNFGGAMLDVPIESTASDDGRWFEAYTERIPLEGTLVRLTLKPKAEAPPSELTPALKGLQAATVGEGSTAATQQAWSELAAAPPEALPELLASMKDASPVAENWLRTAIDAIADRVGVEALPVDELVRYVRDRDNPDRARRTAYELVRRANAPLADALLEGGADDPSVEIRYDAVAKLLDKAAAEPGEASKTALYRKALDSARSLPQVEAAAAALGELGEEVSLSEVLGMVTAWRVAGPFDNRGGRGFDTEYEPERTIDPEASYTGHDEEGPQGPFGWRPYVTADRLGEVELSTAIGGHKGAVGYAWAEIKLDEPRSIEIRYSSRAATKVWLNGQELASQETYHSGSPFDQHVVPAKLWAGENTLLLKACQNEQTEPWAQVWPFTLRITAPGGAPLDGFEVLSPETNE